MVSQFRGFVEANLVKLLRLYPINATIITHVGKFGYFSLTRLEGVQESGYFNCTDCIANHEVSKRDWSSKCFVQVRFFRKK